MIGFFILFIVLATIFLGLRAASSHRRIASNSSGTYEGGCVTRHSEGALGTRYLIVKQGATTSGILVCGATDTPLGILTDEAEESGDVVMVITPGGADGTVLVIPAVSISAGDVVYTAAAGKVTNVPVAGCRRIGIALEDGTADEAMALDPQGFGAVWATKQVIYAGKLAMAGGNASEAATVTGLLATDVVVATITDNLANDNVSLLEAKPSADTLTLLFSEDPTAGVVVDYMVLR